MKNIIIIVIALVISLSLSQCKSSSTAGAGNTKGQNKGDVTSNWQIGIQTWTFRMFTLEEAIEKADSAGVKNIEAFWGQRLSKNGNDTFGIRLSPAGRAALKEMLKSKGVSITAMGVISPRTREEWV